MAAEVAAAPAPVPAAGDRDRDLDLLRCPICWETYRDPQLLTSCGHTFCKACVESLLPVSSSCPTCRSRIPRSDGYRPNYALRLAMQDLGTGRATMPAAGEASDAAAEPASIVRHDTTDLEDLSEVEERRRIKALTVLGLPWGLARLVREEDAQIARRIFLLDNSGSTATCDGRILVDNRMRNCTRWNETVHMALEQAKWNMQVGTPCEFVLLNPVRGTSPDQGYPCVDQLAGQGGEAQVNQLEAMLRKVQPLGPTPLADRVNEIYSRIAREREQLEQAGQRVVLIIATDGMPSGRQGGSGHQERNRFIQTLRRIATLPVHIVIRLTTNDDSVVEFYNKIDEELEFPLEVLDDIASEAQEVFNQGNGWLTYSPLVHTLREQGTLVKLFDLLDERRLAPVEVMVLARLLLQDDDLRQLPLDPEELCAFAHEQLNNLPLVYNPLSRRMEPCINVSRLRGALLPLGQRLAACCAKRRRTATGRALHGSWWALVAAWVRAPRYVQFDSHDR